MSNGGMRRILKAPVHPAEWIRHKYNKGLYDIGRGGTTDSSIPIVHEILTLNPPVSVQPARMPPDIMDESVVYRPTERAMQQYIERYERKKRDYSSSSIDKNDSLQEQDRMARVLGVDRKSPTFNKSVVMGNAYEFALKQLKIQSQHPSMTEEESVDAVEKMLAEHDFQERRSSRDISDTIEEEAELNKKKQDRMEAMREDGATDNTTSTQSLQGIPSILHGDSRTALQLTTWGERLQQVPYPRWSLGAATALDHWIATKILKLSEQTWDMLLEGREEAGMSRGRDILMTRQSLFPETVMQDEAGYMMEADDSDIDAANEYSADQRIDDLLATLDFDNADASSDDNWNFEDDDDDDDEEHDVIGEEEQYQAKLDSLLDQLQRWRERNVHTPFDQWDIIAKQEFDEFLQKYIAHITPNEADRELIDMQATRTALISHPPMSREASSSFFSHLKDETEAELFLDALSKDDTTTNNNNDDDDTVFVQQFLQLPRQTQLTKLMAIGTLRPLYDEYATPKAREAFLKQNQEFLLRGVTLPASLVANSTTSVKKDSHTSTTTEDVPYGTAQGQKEEEVLQKWGEYKSAKAKYEEELFRKGELGLEYEQKHKTKNKKK